MTTLEVRERGRIEVADDVVSATPPAFWKDADCTVTRGAGEACWILKAGDSVGVTRTVTEVGDVTLRIRPKLDTADPFFLAEYAYAQRQDPLRLLDNDVAMEALARDPSACLLAWHARSIHRFAARWLRRDYRTVDRALQGKVKGRILVSRYVSHHLAAGDAATVPCRLPERTQDTANNRLLKAALRFIVSASHSLEVPAARRVVLREAKAALPLFANVADVRVSPRAIRETSSRGPNRHYAPVLAASISLLKGQLLGDRLGSDVDTTSFMWQMPVLFQEAVRGIVDSAAGVTLLPREIGSTSIVDSRGKKRARSHADPDLVLDVYGTTLLVDTKYKDAMPSGHDEDEMLSVVADRHRVKVSRDDIYQAVAYRQHEKWPCSTSALLYPLVLADGDDLPSPLRVLGFGEPVWLLFIDVGKQAARNLPRFTAILRGLASTSDIAV